MAVQPIIMPETSTATRDTVTRLLLARFDYADSYRQQWEDRAVEGYKLYIGYRKEWEEDENGKRRRIRRSNIHVPRPYELADALRARIVKSFFASRPYVEFIPKPDSTAANRAVLQANDRKARVAAALVDDQLDKNGIYRLWYDYVTCFLIFPLAIMSVGWRFEQRRVRRRVEVPAMMLDPRTLQPVPMLDPITGQPVTQLQVTESLETAWDDNELRVVHFFDWWGDPAGYDIDSCRFCFEREELTWQQILERQELLAQHVAAVGAGQVFRLNKDDLPKTSEFAQEGKWRLLSEVGREADPQGDHWERDEQPGDKYEVLHYWTDTEHAMIVNRSQLAYMGENPYWRHGKKPYVITSFDPMPKELYGLSAMHIIRGLSEEHDTLRNQRIDAVSAALNRMWLRRRGADISDDQLVDRPNGIIDVDDFTDLQELPKSDVKVSGYNEEAIIKQDQENALGVAPVVRGVGSSRAQTATEIMNQTQGAAVRFDVKIALYQFTGFSRMVELMDMNNQQFIATERLVRLYDADNAWEWVTTRPGEIIGEYDYRPAGSNVDPTANKEVRRAQLGQMIEAVWKLNIPYFDRYKLVRLWAESFDLRNVDSLLLTPQDLQQMMLMEQMMSGRQAAPIGLPPQLRPGGPGPFLPALGMPQGGGPVGGGIQ